MERNASTYNTLEEIRLRKNSLKSDIAANEKNIVKIWRSMFNYDKPKSYQSPSRRLAGIISTGAGLLDGVLLGWKLYRKFIR